MGVNDLGLLPRSLVTMTFSDPNCSQLDTDLAAKSFVEKITEFREYLSIGIITSQRTIPMECDKLCGSDRIG